MDKFRELEAFVAVVDAGSFVKAAEVLRSSKAAISRIVLELEARLGARLLHRTTRSLSLTESGRVYYARARQLLDDLNEADSIVGLNSTCLVGPIKINAPLSFGVSHLASLWPQFIEANPRVELDITLTDRIVDLIEEGFDVAIRITRMQDSSLVSRRLATANMVMCASPQYLARHGTPLELADLVNHNTLAYAYAPSGDTWSLDSPDGPRSVTVRPRMRANNGDTCRASALAHQGIISQPTFMIGDDLASGALVPILSQYTFPELGIYAVYPSRKHLSGKVRALIDFLAAAFASRNGGRL